MVTAMATKGLLDQLGVYMVTRQQMQDALPGELKEVGLEFDKADRIIFDAISQAQCMVHALVGTAKKASEKDKINKIPVINMREANQ